MNNAPRYYTEARVWHPHDRVFEKQLDLFRDPDPTACGADACPVRDEDAREDEYHAERMMMEDPLA